MNIYLTRNSIVMKRVLLFFSFLLCGFILQAQKVGLVLSGGGAKGMTHIGIIRALEENNIPIDYITGTSMGAIIGSLYAMGYSRTIWRRCCALPTLSVGIRAKWSLNTSIILRRIVLHRNFLISVLLLGTRCI